MKHTSVLLICLIWLSQNLNAQNNLFPDGTKIPEWFLETSKININELGKKYLITDYGAINDSVSIQTIAIQNTINEAARQGGGVIIIPKGVFLSGALFFKPKTHLYISKGAVLKGSDDISNYPKMPSRMEGQNLDYFPALINAYNVDGFTISGNGTINGNGLNYWKAFWQRRSENPKCTNLEVSRPRLIFIWNSNNIQFQDVKLINAGFWTSHFYKCNNVKLIDLYIHSPYKPIKAPSTDAIDIDASSNFLIKGCYLSVNDDAIALKGGKGPWADKDPNNGENRNILIEDCEFGFCHSALTFGSESIYNRNVLMRNCIVNGANRLLWLKMRPDTPQKYEFITVENIKGQANSCIYIKPWTQFFDLKGRNDIPVSVSKNVNLKNIDLQCEIFFNVTMNDNGILSDFTFENLKIDATKPLINKSIIKNLTLKNVMVNNTLIK